MCFLLMFAQSKKQILTIFLGDSHRSQKDKRVGDRKGIKASTAGHVAPCQWTHCWNAGWTLGIVMQNNQRDGSLLSNDWHLKEKKAIARLRWCFVWQKMTTPTRKTCGMSFQLKEKRARRLNSDSVRAHSLWEDERIRILAKHTSCVKNTSKAKMFFLFFLTCLWEKGDGQVYSVRRQCKIIGH